MDEDQHGGRILVDKKIMENIDLEEGKILVNGKWLTEDEIRYAIKMKVDSDDYNVLDLALALQTLINEMNKSKILRVRVPMEIAEAFEEESIRRGVSVESLLRDVLIHSMGGQEELDLEEEIEEKVIESPEEEEESLDISIEEETDSDLLELGMAKTVSEIEKPEVTEVAEEVEVTPAEVVKEAPVEPEGDIEDEVEAMVEEVEAELGPDVEIEEPEESIEIMKEKVEHIVGEKVEEKPAAILGEEQAEKEFEAVLGEEKEAEVKPEERIEEPEEEGEEEPEKEEETEEEEAEKSRLKLHKIRKTPLIRKRKFKIKKT